MGDSTCVLVVAPKNEKSMDVRGFMHEEIFCDVQLLFLFCICPTCEEWDLIAMGLYWGGGVSLLINELPPHMTSWLLRRNQEKFDPLRFVVFKLQC